jgi:uncharacterized protein YuzE
VRPRVTLDPETGYAYIYLAEPHVGIAKTSVPLLPDRDEPNALRSLALDFDADGRLVGMEVFGPADHVLRPELLDDAERLS